MSSKTTTASIPEDENIQDNKLIKYVRGAMTIYGSYVLENRAIPDYRDGLKPVHRRILWGAYQLGLHGYKGLLKKSVRVVGDVLGKYHPHGDQATYDALVNMVHTCQPCIFGSGNFGTVVNRKPAAMRYTEARLTQYADQVFFDPNFIDITLMAPNFDGSEMEPVVLPAKLPNLLLNGAFGIAAGATCSIPAFEAEGVLKITKMALQEKTITPRLAMKYLKPRSQDGGSAYLEESYYQEGLDDFFKNGTGFIWWAPSVEIEGNVIYLNGFSPASAGNLTTSITKAADDEDVSSVVDESDIDEDGNPYICFSVHLKQRMSTTAKEEAFERIEEYFSHKQGLMFTVTERLELSEETGEVPVLFRRTNITEFMQLWAEWRIEVERKSVNNLREKEQEQLDKTQLLYDIVIRRDEILDALKKALLADDSSQTLAKILKVDSVFADTILNMRIRQLKALEEKNLASRIKTHKGVIKQLNKDYKDPTNRISGQLDDLGDYIT